MALAVQSTVNLDNPTLEGLTQTDLIRRGLASGGFQEDSANKAFNGPSHIVNFTTTDATPEVFLSLGAAFTRSVPNPLGSASLNDPQVLAGVDVTTAARARRVVVEIEQSLAGVRNLARLEGVVRNAATPTIQTQLAVVAGALNGASTITLTAAAGVLNLTVTGVAATAYTWVAKVFLGDLL